MAYSQIVKTKCDGQITLKDNGGANSLVVDFEEGNFVLNIPGPVVLLFRDRGKIQDPPALRYGDEQPMSGTFSAYLRDLDDPAADILEQMLTQGIPDGWVSTMGVDGEVQTVTAEYLIAGVVHGDAHNHNIVCPYSTFGGSLQEGQPSTLSYSFTSHAVYPTVT